ncbi:transcriptional regulator [Acidovorax sp. HMWF018]|uniref:TfoX/Sxy family protein n=1 Tax=Acidovorax sp. HMWF018 TaxID=2056855 RepID=UPI000D3BA696|nr:TfoX/Sxy family protein [Acidovorax sp. HMWF018]PTT38497.1 transcriptional regulator [Acidovorax sp. HMWF018]
MPARPLSDETLHLIDAVRTALAHRSDVEERALFGTHAFFVDGKMCIAVKGEELLVRLPPERHGELQEMQNTRELSPGGGMKGYFWVEPNGFSTRTQWSFWIDEALAYNPHAKAAPPKKKRSVAKAQPATPKKVTATGARTKGAAAKAAKPLSKKPTAKKHSIFEADD